VSGNSMYGWNPAKLRIALLVMWMSAVWEVSGWCEGQGRGASVANACLDTGRRVGD
jgi:hypothetical protein